MRLLIRGLPKNNPNSKDNSHAKDNTLNQLTSITINEQQIKSFQDLQSFLTITNQYFKPTTELSFFVNGKSLNLNDIISTQYKIIEVKEIIRGGKGGFGSLLKGQPAVKKRTNNFDSCRDLSGRRIRHVNQERILREWYQKKMEEERLLKALNNPDEENNVKAYIDSDNKKAVHKLNKNYIEVSAETTNSISDSIKYLLKKRLREEGNTKDIKEEDVKYDYSNSNIDLSVLNSNSNSKNNKKVENNLESQDNQYNQENLDNEMEIGKRRSNRNKKKSQVLDQNKIDKKTSNLNSNSNKRGKGSKSNKATDNLNITDKNNDSNIIAESYLNEYKDMDKQQLEDEIFAFAI